MQKEIQDPILGTLTFDEKDEDYKATIDWNGTQIEMIFPMDDPGITLADLLPKAYILYKEQKEWDQKIRQYAAGELLELKNKIWLEDDEEELTQDDFVKRITPESIIMLQFEEENEEDFIMWFDDGDIFWGHGIEVWGNLQEGLTSANIIG